MESNPQAQLVQRKKDNTATIGMLIFLASWAMMFAACFYSYVILRVSSGGWPPDGMPALPIVLPSINTLVLIGSSASLHLAIRAVREGKQKAFVRWLILTPVLGFIFTILQLVLWQDLMGEGLRHTSGSYGSAFYFLTGFHALHILVGLVLLIRVLPRALRGEYTPKSHHPIRLVAMFWHFVDLVWIFMFLSVFCL